MATSGTKTWKLDVIELIEEAYDRLGGEMTTGHELKTARRSLNILFAEWSNEGINLWTIDSQTYVLADGEGSVALPAHCLDVLDVYLTRQSTDYPMERQSRADYLRISDKDTEGMPRWFYVDRQLTPVMKLWPVPENSSDTLTVYYLSRIEDANSYGNDLDVPSRFMPALCSGLAWHLSFKRPTITPDIRSELYTRYRAELDLAKAGDTEITSLFLRPRHYP
jgi:hypothetical protein